MRKAVYCALGLLLGAWSLSGCAPDAGNAPEGLFLPSQDIYRRAPDFISNQAKVWVAKRTPLCGTYVIELYRTKGLSANAREIHIFTISGKMKVRVGPREEVVGPLTYITVPSWIGYRLSPIGREPARFAAMFVPDTGAPAEVAFEDESPGP